MAMRENDPFRNFRFRVEIDGINQAGFTDVSGIDATIDPIEYRVGNDPTHFRKLSGLTKYSNIVLKWGSTNSLDMYNWIQSALEGKIERKNIAIHAMDEEGGDVATWSVEAAWPQKYTGPTFDSKGNAVAIEQLDLAHEGIKRTA
ncbi:MAG: phage tail protein [Clostridia bacterium]|nr:phage tail protein [Clostridia bacterium]